MSYVHKLIVLSAADSNNIEEVVSRFKSQYMMQDIGYLPASNVVQLHC